MTGKIRYRPVNNQSCKSEYTTGTNFPEPLKSICGVSVSWSWKQYDVCTTALNQWSVLTCARLEIVSPWSLLVETHRKVCRLPILTCLYEHSLGPLSLRLCCVLKSFVVESSQLHSDIVLFTFHGQHLKPASILPRVNYHSLHTRISSSCMPSHCRSMYCLYTPVTLAFPSTTHFVLKMAQNFYSTQGEENTTLVFSTILRYLPNG